MKFVPLKLLLLLLALNSSVVLAEPAGLLLGIRQGSPTPDNPEAFSPEQAYEYVTVWIYPKDGEYRYASGPDLLVPTGDGFRKVKVVRQDDPKWVEDHLLAFPLGGPVRPDPGPPWGTTGHISNRITYLGPKGMSVLQHSSGYTEGAAHPWNNWSFQTRRLVDLFESRKIEEIWGEAGEQRLEDGARRYIEQYPGREDHLETEPKETSWGIVRKPGSWEVIGFLGHGAEVYRGSYATFPVGLDEKIFVGHDAPAVPLDEIKSEIPGALDAFQAPGAAPLVVLTESHLHVFDVWPSQRSALVVDLGKPSEPVMAEWAMGPYVSSWTESVLRFVGADI